MRENSQHESKHCVSNPCYTFTNRQIMASHHPGFSSFFFLRPSLLSFVLQQHCNKWTAALVPLNEVHCRVIQLLNQRTGHSVCMPSRYNVNHCISFPSTSILLNYFDLLFNFSDLSPEPHHSLSLFPLISPLAHRWLPVWPPGAGTRPSSSVSGCA
jgi:hypothetical protein